MPVKYLYLILIISSSLMNAQVATFVPDNPEDIKPILVGTQLPELLVKTPTGSNFDVTESVKEKPTILIFFRGGWCPYCNAHLAKLQEIESELVKLGYQILAISPDKPELLRVPVEEHGLKYQLFSDSEMLASRAMGIAFKMKDDMVEKYKGYGIDIETDSGYDHHLLPVPAAFVVGQDGTIKFSYVNPNYKIRIDGDVLIAAAKSALMK
ncbi:MAG: AhpC/TSA family protein [Bacteroidetes bacterium]|nr:AhpC/TSA family protein [Bacteroidota bacterium]